MNKTKKQYLSKALVQWLSYLQNNFNLNNGEILSILLSNKEIIYDLLSIHEMYYDLINGKVYDHGNKGNR